MARFAIVDLYNLYYRAANASRDDAFTRSGFSIQFVFRSCRKLFHDMGCDHLVICAEGRSWRYDAYPMYKAHRKVKRAEMTPAEREDDLVIKQGLDDLVEYFEKNTRATVLRSFNAEGDDYIARFIRLHKDDEHVILSTDSDFIQLIAENVTIYDAMLDRVISRDGVTDSAGRELVFEVDPSKGKIKIKGTLTEETEKHRRAEKAKAKENSDYTPKPYEWSVPEEWWKQALFIKLIRGDASDGIFSAYPGVRFKGTKTKVGIIDAWSDRNSKGFEWNNFMNQEWSKSMGTSPDGQPITEMVKVKDAMEENRILIDLTAQPQHVVEEMDEKIVAEIQKPPVSQVGTAFLKFCGKHQLVALSREASQHGMYLNVSYPMGG